MATILTKRSNTASSVPVAGDLTNSTGGAELAVNTADKRLFTKDSGGTVVELGTNPSTFSLPNGTANGVPYLNGSKVLTTGSALVFDGSNLGLGTGANTLGAFLAEFNGSGTTATARFSDTFAQNGFEILGASTVLLSAYNRTSSSWLPLRQRALQHEFYVGTSEQMRLTSTGLGIGTSSPAGRLDVVGTADQIRAGNGTVTSFLGGSGSNGYTGTLTNHAFLFYTNSAERMRLDSSGNLGLGVTPSAWTGTAKHFEFGNVGNALRGGTNDVFLTENAYFSSGWKYGANGSAAMYNLSQNTHTWYTAPSGTAGNAISFTQAMTLSALGYLGIGNTSPATPLHIDKYSDGDTSIFSRAGGTNNPNLRIRVNESAATAGLWADGAAIWSNMTFSTGGSERARIDSSGNLLVGTTSAPNNQHRLVKDRNDGYAVEISNSTTGNPYGLLIYYPGKSGLSTVNELYLKCQDTTATRMYVMSNGGIANYSANNANLSDRREKINFAPAGEYLSKICAIPVQTYNYIDQNMEEDPGTTLGVVAQDVQAVAPELVMESNWGTEENPKMRLSIYQTDLQYALMKALQELKAEFDAYKASHP